MRTTARPPIRVDQPEHKARPPRLDIPGEEFAPPAPCSVDISRKKKQAPEHKHAGRPAHSAGERPRRSVEPVDDNGNASLRSAAQSKIQSASNRLRLRERWSHAVLARLDEALHSSRSSGSISCEHDSKQKPGAVARPGTLREFEFHEYIVPLIRASCRTDACRTGYLDLAPLRPSTGQPLPRLSSDAGRSSLGCGLSSSAGCPDRRSDKLRLGLIGMMDCRWRVCEHDYIHFHRQRVAAIRELG